MRIVQSLVFVGILLLGSVGFSAEEAGAELPEMKRLRMNRDCLRINRIRDNYEFLDYSNMVVWAGRRNPYHVRLSTGCQAAANFVGQVTFQARGGLLCGGPGEYIVMRDVFGRLDRRRDNDLQDRCMVRSVRALGEEGLYELMIELNKVPPPPPMPPPKVEVLPTDEEAEPAVQNEEKLKLKQEVKE